MATRIKGDIVKAERLGRKNDRHTYIRAFCELCNTERWVILGNYQSGRARICQKCRVKKMRHIREAKLAVSKGCPKCGYLVITTNEDGDYECISCGKVIYA